MQLENANKLAKILSPYLPSKDVESLISACERGYDSRIKSVKRVEKLSLNRKRIRQAILPETIRKLSFNKCSLIGDLNLSKYAMLEDLTIENCPTSFVGLIIPNTVRKLTVIGSNISNLNTILDRNNNSRANIRELTVDSVELAILPDNIERLTIRSFLSDVIKDLPSNLVALDILGCCIERTRRLPYTLRELNISTPCNLHIEELPSSVSSIIVSCDVAYLPRVPLSVLMIEAVCSYIRFSHLGLPNGDCQVFVNFERIDVNDIDC
jgi:hypothetical protein